MIELGVKIDGMTELKAFLSGMERQLPFATARALTATAFDVREAEQKEILGTFDNPTPWIRRSPRVTKATKRNLSARVFIDPEAMDVLQHHVEGGPRVHRDIVRQLIRAGRLRPGEYVTYAPGFVNQRGNLTLGGWRRIAAGLNKPGGKYFIDPRRRAIWIKRGRGGRQVAPVAFITRKRPTYRARFDFYGTAKRTVDRVWQQNFNRALQRALETAR